MNDWRSRLNPPTLQFPPLFPGSDIPRSALLFQSDDLELARMKIGRVYRPYRFTASERRTMPVTMFKLDGDGMALTWFAYGTDISIRPEICGDFALVLTTLAGHSEARSGPVYHVGRAGSTVLVASDARSEFRYSAENVQLGVRVDARRIADIWRSIARREPPLAVPVPALFDAARRDRWLASVQLVRQLLDPDTPAALRAMQLPRAEEILLMSLVGEQLTDAVPAERGLAAACVRRAVAFIEEHAERPLTLTDIAEASHCSVRTLHRAFQQWRDVGVMRYLKDVRLGRVRMALQDPDEMSSITEIATRWGFSHLGQFATDYRKMFMERPSDTRVKR
ncbi:MULTISPECIES: helix-turn-helix transcriptional regulator [Pseudomonas]|uniref:helix-turn-helix transcriptional regulator n=1 Tax=Pseudomonas TaxID=286 RepID=UPI00235E6A4E|nr:MULTISPECIES: AraC family transcriptional regulator [Pseudomonas]WJV25632.1 AraC family transcriptional regulator [Pseudomonas chlororaphis]